MAKTAKTATKAKRTPVAQDAGEIVVKLPKQTRIPGTDQGRIGDIEEAAIVLRRVREARAKLGDKAKTHAAVLAEAMRRHGQTVYVLQDELPLVARLNEKETVSVQPEGEEDE